MIVFVTLSPRRVIVVSLPDRPTGFQGVGEGQGDQTKGFLTAEPTRKSDPLSYPKARRLATEWARETGQLIEYKRYQEMLK